MSEVVEDSTEMELPKSVDFKESISVLENRSNRARKTMLMIGTSLVTIILMIVLFIFFQFQNKDISFNFGGQSLSMKLEQRASKIAGDLIFQQVSGDNAEKKLKETIDLLQQLDSSNKNSTGITSSLSTIAFSFGAVGFIILLIQIAVQFMRYYARLSELYSAQALALRASGGDPIVAFQFIEHFSPASVDIGKTPSSVYEKALEAISSVSKKKA